MDSATALLRTVNNISVMVSYWDAEGRCVFANEAHRAVFGVSPDEMRGMHVSEFLGAQYPEFLPHIVGVLSGERQVFERRRLRPDGTTHHALVTYAPDIVDGLVVGFSVQSSDVTALREREAAHAESDERLRLALQATSDAIWDWDPAVGTVYLSPQWYTMLGYPVGPEIQPIHIVRDHVHPDDASRVTNASRGAIGEGTAYVVQARMRCADGSYKWIESRGSVSAWDANGQATRFSGINSDIHARKLAEEETARLEAQLQQAQKMESVGRLAGGVAHDFNNMLGVILGHTEFAMGQVDASHPLRADLVEIRRAAERSAALTRQLLAFARKQVVEPTVLDLNEAVSHSLSMLQRLIGENIHVNWRPSTSPWSIRMDPTQVDQLLTNLCVNARDAIADVGTVSIETENVVLDAAFCAAHAGAVPGEYVRLTVTDDGAGMDEETLNHIFEPFFTTKGFGAGTGLGLAMVYGVMKQNGGFIAVRSAPGQGTSFDLFLPRHHGADAAARRDSAQISAEFGTETVLLVEDETAILKLTARALSKLGYLVLRASSPVEAIRLAAEYSGTVDLLLTDVVMPEMNGKDLAIALHARFPQIKTMFMSGYTADVIVSRGVLDEGVHFIQKPFLMSALAAKVREVLDEPAKPV